MVPGEQQNRTVPVGGGPGMASRLPSKPGMGMGSEISSIPGSSAKLNRGSNGKYKMPRLTDPPSGGGIPREHPSHAPPPQGCASPVSHGWQAKNTNGQANQPISFLQRPPSGVRHIGQPNGDRVYPGQHVQKDVGDKHHSAGYTFEGVRGPRSFSEKKATTLHPPQGNACDPAKMPSHALKSNPASPASEVGDAEDGDNCLTKFNELCQKGIAGLRAPKYQYVYRGPRPGSGPRWECTATTAAKHANSEEPVTLSTLVTAKNKKDARRIAAKKLLQELVNREILTKDTIDTKGGAGAEASQENVQSSDMTPAMVKECAAAVSILNQLWQKGKFLCQHKYTLQPVSSGANGRWKCNLFIKTRQKGDVEASHEASQKKQARAIAAYLAVEKLKEMKFPGINEINVDAKPQSNVSTSVPKCGSEGSSDGGSDDDVTLAAALDETTGASSEDEDEEHDMDVFAGGGAFGGHFAVPNDVSILIAKDVADCNSWVAENAGDGCKLGLYLDSASAREAFKAFAKKGGIEINSEEFRTESCRAICFASNRSAIFVCAHLLGDANAVEVPQGIVDTGSGQGVEKEADNPSGKGDQGEDKACPSNEPGEKCSNGTESESKSPTGSKSWIPTSIKMLLERREFAKYGSTVKEGVISLRVFHGIECRGVHELGIASVALRGADGNRRAVMPRLQDLVRDWLRQRIDPFSSTCIESVSGLSEVVSSSKDIVAQAVPVAVAAFLIEGRLGETAESRKRKRYSNTDEYLELCNRLCTQPSDPAPVLL